MERLIPANPDSAPVIALHCAGAAAGPWRQLGETLGPAYTLFAPEHYGCERTGPWTGTHAFTLADEVARTIDLIDSSATTRSRDGCGDGALLSAGAVVTYHCQAAGFAITFNAGRGQMKNSDAR